MSNKVPAVVIEEIMNSLVYEFHLVKGTTVTACWSMMPDGYQVGYGQSVCVDPNDFNQMLGERMAKKECKADSRNKLWEMESYHKKKSLIKANNMRELV